ncbi:hypothetical protein KJ966_27635 [bacterium]|nr:hypothetical protein [bacterium]
MKSFYSLVFLKTLMFVGMVLAVIFIFQACASSDSDDDSSDASSCPSAESIADDTVCLVISDATVEGTKTSDSAVPDIQYDPWVDFSYKTEDVAYRITFIKDYTEGATSYPTFGGAMDGFNIFYGIDFDGTPAAQEVSLSSTGFYITFVVYSPAGTSDLYIAQSATTGSSASATISSETSAVGEKFQGTIGESILCKVGNDLQLVDDCATSITISSGVFNVTRTGDTKY